MATYRVKFNKAFLEKVPTPLLPTDRKSISGGVYDTYYDTKEKGLVLLVSNGGAKTYYLYAKIHGKPERIKLGPFSDLSIEQARKKAAKNRGDIADGNNPQEAKRAFRQEATFKELFHEYLEKYSKKHKKSWKYDEREIQKFLSGWYNRKISSITNLEVKKLHEQIRDENGLYQANRLLERIRAIYNKAIEWGWKGINPAIGIRKYTEKSRDRFLQPHELPCFFESLKAEQNYNAKDFITLSLLTGARKSNMLAMRWEEISFERAEWRIPETKNGEPLRVALSNNAIEILESRQKSIKGAWVFPSSDSRSGHFEDPKKAWNRILTRAETYQLIGLIATHLNWGEAEVKAAKSESEYNLKQSLAKYKELIAKSKIDAHWVGFKDLRIHDLRRSLGSWQAATGANQYVIGKSLGHKSEKSTKVYARLNLDPVRESVQKANDAILKYATR